MVVCGGEGERICHTLMEATHVLDVGALAWSQCIVSASRGLRDDLPVRVPPEDAYPRCRLMHSTAVRARSAPADPDCLCHLRSGHAAHQDGPVRQHSYHGSGWGHLPGEPS